LKAPNCRPALAGCAAITCATEQTAAAFDRVKKEAGRIDILVDSAWGGYEQMLKGGKFT